MKKLLLLIPLLAALGAAQSLDYVPPTTINGLHILGGASGSALTLSSGTPNADVNAGLTLQSNGAGALTLQPGANGGTIVIGGTAQTGTITLGSSSGTQTVAIGAGAGAATVNIAGGNGGDTVNIGGGSGTNAVNIGAAGTTATVSLLGLLKADCGTGTAVANAVTLQKQCGVITSSTANLAAVTSENITLTDARIAATNLIFATTQTNCTGGGQVVPVAALAGSGTATITMRNVHATTACTSTYTVAYWILSQ